MTLLFSIKPSQFSQITTVKLHSCILLFLSCLPHVSYFTRIHCLFYPINLYITILEWRVLRGGYWIQLVCLSVFCPSVDAILWTQCLLQFPKHFLQFFTDEQPQHVHVHKGRILHWDNFCKKYVPFMVRTRFLWVQYNFFIYK